VTTAPASVAAIVLAAGRSSRMGAHKMLADIAGKPMVRWAVEAALQSRARPVLVVTGHEAAQVQAALTGLDVRFVHNGAFATGLSSSLKAGIRALPPTCDGALILLGDMPEITAAHIDRLIEAFTPDTIVVPTHEGQRGNPVLWPARCFEAMLQLDGDTGAKRLLDAGPDLVREVDVGTPAISTDVDTPDALARLRARRQLERE
jgi:molybdenum cofactor cytidylyltransferase